jgi:nucleotide-binding universal stress UspA family protein
MFSLSRILVPTNLGEPSKAAIRYGVAFARQFNAKLILLHVFDEKAYEATLEAERVVETLMPDDASASPPTRETVKRNAAREYMNGLLDDDDEQATGAAYLLRSSGTHGPGDAIIACAEELKVELVVMGKHRMGFVEHLIAGSVTEKVMRHAPCPVLIVHYPEQEFVIDD